MDLSFVLVFLLMYKKATQMVYLPEDNDDPGVSSFLVFNSSTKLGGLFIGNKYMNDKSSIVDIITKAISH